jgi:hypothetical protein
MHYFETELNFFSLQNTTHRFYIENLHIAEPLYSETQSRILQRKGCIISFQRFI